MILCWNVVEAVSSAKGSTLQTTELEQLLKFLYDELKSLEKSNFGGHRRSGEATHTKSVFHCTASKNPLTQANFCVLKQHLTGSYVTDVVLAENKRMLSTKMQCFQCSTKSCQGKRWCKGLHSCSAEVAMLLVCTARPTWDTPKGTWKCQRQHYGCLCSYDEEWWKRWCF